MNRYTLMSVLLLPSIVAGFLSVADRGAAIFMAPLLLILPMAQAVMFLAKFRIDLNAAMVTSVVFWIGLGTGSQYIYSRHPKVAVFAVFTLLGIINAAFVPWSVGALAWYA